MDFQFVFGNPKTKKHKPRKKVGKRMAKKKKAGKKSHKKTAKRKSRKTTKRHVKRHAKKRAKSRAKKHTKRHVKRHSKKKVVSKRAKSVSKQVFKRELDKLTKKRSGLKKGKKKSIKFKAGKSRRYVGTIKRKNPYQDLYADSTWRRTAGKEGVSKQTSAYFSSSERKAVEAAMKSLASLITHFTKVKEAAAKKLAQASTEGMKGELSKLISGSESLITTLTSLREQAQSFPEKISAATKTRLEEAKLFAKDGLKFIGTSIHSPDLSETMFAAMSSVKSVNESLRKAAKELGVSVRAEKKASKKVSKRKARKSSRKASRKAGKKSSKKAGKKKHVGHAAFKKHFTKVTRKGGLGRKKSVKLHLKKGKQKFTITVRRNPMEGFLGKIESMLDHSMAETAGLVVGGAAHSGINDLTVRYAPTFSQTIQKWFGAFGGAVMPLLAGGLLSFANKRYIHKDVVGEFAKGLIGSALVGVGAVGYESVMAVAAPAAGVDYTPMKGVAYTPMKGVDYTPMQGVQMTPMGVEDSPADFGAEDSPADFGFEESKADFGAEESPADFGSEMDY